MKLDEHLKMTNGEGKEIHEFLDQYYTKYSIDHRLILHHKLGIALIGKLFGSEAMSIAESHIRSDWGGALPDNFEDRRFYQLAWACDDQKFQEATEFAINLFINQGLV